MARISLTLKRALFIILAKQQLELRFQTLSLSISNTYIMNDQLISRVYSTKVRTNRSLG